MKLPKVKKSDILQPGTYGACPLEVLADCNITPAAKLVYMAILNFMYDNESAFPSISTIAATCGISKRAAITAVENLETEKRIVTEKRRGASTHYYFTPLTGAKSALVKPTNLCKICTGAKSALVQNLHEPVQNLHQSDPKLVQNLHPTHSLPLNTHSTRVRKVLENENGGEGKAKMTLDETTQKIKAAYREAFKSEMPVSWNAKISEHFDAGDMQIQTITADVLQRAERYRKTAGLSNYGFGVVMNFLEHIARQTGMKFGGANVNSPVAVAAKTASAEAEAKKADEEKKQHEQRDAERLKKYHALPATEQDRLLKIIMARPYAPSRIDILEGQAAALAEKEEADEAAFQNEEYRKTRMK